MAKGVKAPTTRLQDEDADIVNWPEYDKHLELTKVTDGELIIAGFNCRFLGSHLLMRMTRWIENGQVDILACMETKLDAGSIKSSYLLASSAGTKKSDGPGFNGGIAIFSSARVKRHYVKTILSEPTILKIQIGKIIVSAVYISPGTSSLEDFKRTLIMAKDSDIVLGDFNCLPPGVEKSLLTHRNNPNISRTLAMADWIHNEDLELASIPSDGSKIPGIDHIWISSSITSLVFRHSGRDIIQGPAKMKSDHGILWFTLTNPLDSTNSTTDNSTDPSLATRFITRKLKKSNARTRLTWTFWKSMDLWQCKLDEFNVNDINIGKDERQVFVDDLDAIITKVIVKSATESLGKFGPRNVETLQQKELQAKVAAITHVKDAHRVIKIASNRTRCTIVSQDETPVLEATTSLFANTYRGQVTQPYISSIQEPNLLYSSFPVYLLYKAIWNYPLDKSPGMDGIDQRLLRALSDDASFLSLLSTTFNVYLQLKTTPTSWNTSLISLLPKEDGLLIPVDKTRPISITLLLRRIFESLILSTIETAGPLDLKKGLSPAQGGFSKRRSTDSHILLSHHGPTHPTSPSQLQVFLDLQKAFDQISHAYLLETLKQRNFPDCLIEIIYNLMIHETYSQVTVNQSITPLIRRNCGVFQGSLLSPLLFNFCIDRLVYSINPTYLPYPTLLLYADDIKIQLPGYQVKETQIILNKCSIWAKAAGLKFGIKKCGAIGLLGNDNLFIDSQIIPKVPSYTYLGLPFTSQGIDFKTFMNKAIDSAEASIRFLGATCKKNVREDIRCNLIKTYARSKLYHGLGIYANWASITSHTVVDKAIISGINSRLEKYQAMERQYMFGFSDYGKDVVNSMANLTNVKQMLLNSKSALALRLITSEHGSPIHIIRHHKSFKTTPVKHTLLYHILKDKLANDVMYGPREVSAQVAFKTTRIQDCHQDNLHNSALVSYISLHCRKNGKMDNLLSCTDASLRRMMIHWRMNKFFAVNSTLSCVCGENRLKRTHFDNCQQFLQYSPISTYTWRRFRLYKAHRRKKRLESLVNDPSHKFPHLDKITILDYLLNKGMYKLFDKVISFLILKQAFRQMVP